MVTSSNEQGLSFVTRFLGQLPSNLEYAIERNIASIEKPLEGDVDIIIHKKDFFRLVRLAKKLGILLSTTITYGGARVFIFQSSEVIKRIDCMWEIHYKGICLDKIGEILCYRVVDPKTNLYVLPEAMQARIAWLIKNSYGGAHFYRDLLERQEYAVLNRHGRICYLVKSIIRRPLSSALGCIRWGLSYLLRISRPTGLLVFGFSVENLKKSPTIRYLFQGRIDQGSRLLPMITRARCMSNICITSRKCFSELDLSSCVSIRSAEETIVRFLRKRRTNIPFLLKLIA